MNLDNLPPEIIDLIASYILFTEVSPHALANRELCNFIDAGDPCHRAPILTTSPPFPAGSSVFSLASVHRYMRNVLFLSRDSRFVKVLYTGEGRGMVEGIRPALLASVDKLRVVARKRPLDTASSPLPKHQGIGDILLPYHYLTTLEIDWHLLPPDDPRLGAMIDCANEIPTMRYDLRCSRACTLVSVGDLHISLGSGTSLMDSPRAEMMGQQVDLILQQFDVPALRSLHFSHDFSGGNVDMLGAQWKKLLPAIRLQYWPYLEEIQICVVAPYHLSTRDGQPDGVDAVQTAVWRPLLKDIIDHLATCKKPLDVNITLHWKFHARDRSSPFRMVLVGDKSDPVLREQLMPTAETFDSFVEELEGRAKDRPFSLQFLASCGTRDKVAKRLLKVSYRPDLVANQGSTTETGQLPPSPSTNKPPQTTTYVINQAAINDLKENLSHPDPNAEEPAADAALAARRQQLLDLQRGLALMRAQGQTPVLEQVRRQIAQIVPDDWEWQSRLILGDRAAEGEEGDDEDDDLGRDRRVRVAPRVRTRIQVVMEEVDDDPDDPAFEAILAEDG